MTHGGQWWKGIFGVGGNIGFVPANLFYIVIKHLAGLVGRKQENTFCSLKSTVLWFFIALENQE